MAFNYDIAIIGGGIGGLMCAYEISEKSDKKVIIFEKGSELGRRRCPIVEKKVDKCIKCANCAIMEGMAGAGAFSDGKYVISTEYGGWLPDFVEPQKVVSLIERADDVLVRFGATNEVYSPSNDLKKLCLQYDLHMLQARIKHLGTDSNRETMAKLINHIRERVTIKTNSEVVGVDVKNHTLDVINGREHMQFSADKIIFAVGRVGSRFFSSWCRENGVKMENNQVDIGVRVELPSLVWDHFSSKIYEPKIIYSSKRYGDKTRMFCFNERGSVVMENTDGVLTVNGHSYRDKSRKTENSNFALLTTMTFTEPFQEPIEYARSVASLSNMLSGGSVLVQRLGDLEAGRRTNEKRLLASTTRPTLKAVPGDLSLCMPKRQLDDIIETLHALDKIAPGTANYNTLLYGIECKYYSARPKTIDFEIKNCPGIYALGDGAGFTRSLSQAAAHGLYIADKILANS
ncbi:MAG: FAD-dependent oxidoreductase [Clostridiales bacterium]|nr:MAG: FAD-dependent oxidoreductase [Clostridiales bacterium]